MLQRIQRPNSPELNKASIQELMLIARSLKKMGNKPPKARSEQGEHKIRIKGHGLELKELRTYQPTDEPRHIDWRVSARTGEPYTRVFEEEKEHSHVLITDLSPNAYFGTRDTFISTRYVQLAALIGGRVKHLRDKFGYISQFGDECMADLATRNWHTFQESLVSMSRLDQRQKKVSNELCALDSFSKELRSKNIILLTDKVQVKQTNIEWLKRITKKNQVTWINIEDTNASRLPTGTYHFMTSEGESTRHISNSQSESNPYQNSKLQLQQELTSFGARFLSYDLVTPPLSIINALTHYGCLR
ncbi:DUF58 domain-containing protein [Marinomonas balearica]|uniref:Uncharacterized protein DUF58 n=1 Tax=Marinomonas balearica TaxID=491947 RepID=A0A4R6MBW1_9GAMM|nr:DUF58 domain-containing protein [Marinomonas balearica]TDO99003.1 uncharacterized protein DUF58 [Marinomonas balearica]